MPTDHTNFGELHDTVSPRSFPMVTLPKGNAKVPMKRTHDSDSPDDTKANQKKRKIALPILKIKREWILLVFYVNFK